MPNGPELRPAKVVHVPRWIERAQQLGRNRRAKAIEDATLENSTVSGGAEDGRNLALDRGRSDFDRRHVSATSVLWDLSYFDKNNRLLYNVGNGWQLSSIITLQSGLPFNVTTGTDVNLDGTNNGRPSLTGNPFLGPNRLRATVTKQWFNTNAFGVPPWRTYSR